MKGAAGLTLEDISPPSRAPAAAGSGRRGQQMRTRSQSRRLADPRAGSGSCTRSEVTVDRNSWSLSLANRLLPSHGSEATATANQLRRCCGGESGWNEAKTRSPKWRDWANLPSELLEEIAGRLLTFDILEFLRFRSACKPWSKCTDDPSLLGGGLDPRFRPHNWIAVRHCASPTRRRLINIRTGARAEVDHAVLSTHRCFGVVDGLLVLCDDKATGAIRLLNPLTGTLTHFPAITNVRETRPSPSATLKAFSQRPLTKEEIHAVIKQTPKVEVPDPSVINGTAIDDSTSPPTLVLGLRGQVRRIICAKPGDQHWVAVHFGEQQEPLYNADGEIAFHSLLSFRGHCYVATCRGDVMRP